MNPPSSIDSSNGIVTRQRIEAQFKPSVNLIQSQAVNIPGFQTKIFLSGAVPTPTLFINTLGVNSTTLHQVEHMTLNELLNVEDFRQTLKDLLTTCDVHGADHLIIASVPVAFASLSNSLGPALPEVISAYLHSIGREMKALIHEEWLKLKARFQVTLVIPTVSQLKHTPNSINPDSLIKELVDGFPTLQMVDEKKVTLYIMDNAGFDSTHQMALCFKDLYPTIKGVETLVFDKDSSLYTYKTPTPNHQAGCVILL